MSTRTADITRHQQAEHKSLRLLQVYAALSNINTAMLRARSEQTLYHDICQAAIEGELVSAACIFSADTERRMTALASAGCADRLHDIMLSTGLVEAAYRSGCYALSSDSQTTRQSETAAQPGTGCAVALPLQLQQKTVAVLLLYSNATHAFDEEVIGLLSSMADNVSFALRNFQSQAQCLEAITVLRESEAGFRSLTQLTWDFYWEMDSSLHLTKYEGKVIHESNQQSIDRAIGYPLWDMDPRRMQPTSMSWPQFQQLLGKRQRFRDFEYRFTNTEGMVYHMALSGEPMFDDRNTFIGYRGIARDVTERKLATEHIRFLATHDPLTKLPNRVMFAELLEQTVRLASRYPNRAFTLLFIDLDRFKLINDSFGHHVGDDLLVAVAKRLRAPLRASDVVARMGGDEFVILLQEVTERDKIVGIANKILEAFATPFLLNEQECRVTASIGISIFGEDASDEETLMKHADAAMYVAKDEGKDNFQFYSQRIHQRTQQRINLELNLRHALQQQELAIFWQPKIDLSSGHIAGVEALLRWDSPQLGPISPQHFIPVAEESGLIVAIGDWVIKTACLQVAAWQADGMAPLNLAVNLSVRQLQDLQFLDRIRSALQMSNIEPRQLELEITESMMTSHPRQTMALLREIKAMGLKLALDDFGTGYSSLGQLKHYPIDTLKIDRLFFAETSQNEDDKTIVQAIVTMGKTLGLTVIAEGVETLEQARFLVEQGCHQGQGFHFLRPMPADDFKHWLQQYDPQAMKKALHSND